MEKMKIGIVGGSGYIGSTLAKKLSLKHDVKIVDLNRPRVSIDNTEYCKCNIIDYGAVKNALVDVDVVIHTAIIQIPLINEKKKLGYDVNFIGTQNICKAVEEISSIKGMILAGTWHVFGERDLIGVIDESFGFRPDKVEERARLYAFSKIAQEIVVRYYSEMSEKIYGVIRLGTVLGEGMPEKTAANIFISRGLKGESITPYKHSMYRPMLYVDLDDVSNLFDIYVDKILKEEIESNGVSLDNIVNIYWPEPLTIYDLASLIRNGIIENTDDGIIPEIEIVDLGTPMLFDEDDKNKLKVDQTRINRFLEDVDLTDPKITITKLIKNRINNN
jgi:UDP-glucose 4-epimerase